MAWPTWAVGRKLTGTMWTAAKDYIDNLSGAVAATANTLVRRDANGNANVGIDLETFAKFTSASSALTSGVVSDRTLTVSAAPGITNDPIYSLSSGQLVIGAPGVYLIHVTGFFAAATARKLMDIINVSGVDVNGRIAYVGVEDQFGGAVLVTVAGSSGTLKLQAYMDVSSTTFSAYLRIQRLARLV